MDSNSQDNLFEFSRRYGLRPEEIVDFSAPMNPLGFSQKVEKKLKANLLAIRRYPDPQCRDLVKALARFHGLAEDQILPGAGATEFIYALPRIFSLKRVLMVTPTLGEYERALESANPKGECQIHYFETREEDGFEVDVNALISSLTLGYDALFLSNPGDLTGILTAKEDLLRILEQTERQNIWFVLDETAIDFIEEHSLKDLAEGCGRLILIRSFSKFFGLPGLRVGYVIANPAQIQKFLGSKEPWTINTLGQIAAMEALEDKAFIRHTQEWLPKERERMIQGLRSIPGFVPYPGSAHSVLVQILPFLGFTAGELRERLFAWRILIRDCQPFHHLGPYFLQITVRTHRQNGLLLKALRQIVQTLPDSGKPSRPA